MRKRQMKKNFKSVLKKTKAVLNIDAKNITTHSLVIGYISNRFENPKAEHYFVNDIQGRRIDTDRSIKKGYDYVIKIDNAKHIRFEFRVSDTDKSYYVIYPPKKEYQEN